MSSSRQHAQNTSNEELGTGLLDSFLHSNIKRILIGIFCGLCAGIFMLIVSSFFQIETGGKLWWLRLTASMFYGGKAFLHSASPAVFVVGGLIHFFLSALCGLIVGKLTTRNQLSRLLFYTFVLGFLCWLASNMYAPDFLDVQFLQSVGQWVRLIIFMSFTLSLGLMMSVLGKAISK